MEYFLQQVLNGLQIGFVYALIALGYTMVYGIVRLINFAHGDVFMVGAFIGMYAIERLQLPLSVVFLLAVFGSALLAVVMSVSPTARCGKLRRSPPSSPPSGCRFSSNTSHPFARSSAPTITPSPGLSPCSPGKCAASR